MHATKGRTTGEESDLSGYGRPSNDVDPGADGNGSGQRLWQRRRLHLCHQRLFQPRRVWQRWTGLLYGGGGRWGWGVWRVSFRLRASANRLRSAARSSLPAVATPSFSNESPYDDDHLGEGHPEVDDSIPTLGTPHQLLMGVVPRVRALHYPTFRRLKRRWLTFLGDCGEQATIL